MIRYANVLGGSGQESSVFATTDAAGNVYLTGTTTSPDFPATVRISDSPIFPDVSLFVVKIDPSGAGLLYSTIIGGGVPAAIASDSSGNVYVAGVEASADYPTTAGSYSATGSCFVSKLDPSGASLIYSTRLPCDYPATVGGLAVDGAGNAYVTGSGSLVTTPGAYRTTGFGAFALKLNPTGSALVYATFLPGTYSTSSVQPHAIAVDPLGAAYIAGSANIQSFYPNPDTLPHEVPSANGPPTNDAMVLKLSPDGKSIVFASLFGGPGDDVASAVAVGTDGSIYVSGASQTSTGVGPPSAFPATPGAADTISGFPKGFVARLAPGGDSFLFSTFLSRTDGAPCLSVTDTGVDVLAPFLLREYTPNIAGTQIMRISPDGTRLVNSSTASSGYVRSCGQGGGNFVVLGSTLTSPNLSPIGNSANVSFSLVVTDDPSAPQFDVNTGELNLICWRDQNGNFSQVRQVIHATANGQAVAVRVAESVPGDPVTVDQPVTTTPADITVIADEGRYSGEVILFAPGAKDGLVLARLNMTEGSILFTFDPSWVQFTADSATSPPLQATVHVSTSVVEDAFGTLLSVPLSYTIGNYIHNLPLPSWLTLANTGLTPENVTFTANPAGLYNGFWSQDVQFIGAGPGPFHGLGDLFPAPKGLFRVDLQIGPASVSPTPVITTLTPSRLTLRFTDPSQQQQSVTVHVSTSADPAPFTVGQLPTWLTASPLSGQTPADIILTATPPGNGEYDAALQIDASSASGYSYGYLFVGMDVALPGYVGTLGAAQITSSPTLGAGGFAPGSLFYISLYRPELTPDEIDPAGPAVWSLAGYSFAANGTPVPLIAYQSGEFLAQMPADAKPGTVTIDGFDCSGTRVATGNKIITALNPDFVTDPARPRARKADGTTIDATNPVAPGDAVLVNVTGLGSVNPPLVTGQTASSDMPSSPVVAVTATIGGKNAEVISAQASESLPGVVDVWLRTPNLYDGDHYITVGAMGVFTPVRIPIKVKNP